MKRCLITFCVALAGFFAAFAQTSSPQYPGGEEAMYKFIAENIKYPAEAAENGIEGVVKLLVTIKSDGAIGTIKVVRMIDPYLEKEAMRVVKSMPRWTPALNEGKGVDAQVPISIRFRLPSSEQGAS